jgi:hypothetical protein
MSRVEYGQVEFELDGETFTLKPTLKAFMKIEKHFGGMRSAIERCSDLSIDGLCTILAAGTGKNLSRKEAEEFADKVFAEGITNLLPFATEYLLLLMNPTGKEPEGDEESGE